MATMLKILRRQASACIAAMAGLMLLATSASAETLLMPKRDFAANQNEVVWGISTLPNGTAYSIDFGDTTPVQNGNVTDRSFIAFNHTFPIAGTFTVTLTVGAEVATTTVNVYDLAGLTAEQARGVNINRAIEDGLRYLWTSQTNQTTFDTTTTTAWGSSPSYTSLVVLSFMNHGYTVPNNNTTPTGLFEKYAVQRGINFLLTSLSSFVVNANTPNGYNACDGVGAGTFPCTLFSQNETQGYSTSLAILPFAGSNALNRTSTVAGITNGMTYRDVLRRLVNGLAWGQNDSGTGRGGWYYSFNSTVSDGSTIGWNMLALLDAAAAGVAPPGFVKPEFTNTAYANAKNHDPDCVPDPNAVACNKSVDGTYDYNADTNPQVANLGNTARVGIGLQSAFYTGAAIGDAYVNAAIAAADRRWPGAALSGDYTATCSGVQNKGCGYAMFNLFKGLKLYGVETLPNVNRPAGSVGHPDDWYADYVDWLINNQRSPQTLAGGSWSTSAGANTNRFGGAQAAMFFSCCANQNDAITALAELILSPVALIQPDPTTFSSIGLRQGNPLSTNPDTNPVNSQHTVVAQALSQGGAAIPGVGISFQITGRNGSVALASGVTDANGEVSRTYTDLGPAASGGVDEIRAFIGQVGSNLASNTLTKNWVVAVNRCDADADNDVDTTDLGIIRSAMRTNASGPTDPRDGNGDGKIDIADVRYCQLRLTPAPQ